jgi:hypothetical protein
MITRFLCEFAVFYHFKIVVSVLKSKVAIPLVVKITLNTCV